MWEKEGNLKGDPAPASTGDISGTTVMTQGQNYVDVSFPAPQPAIGWTLIESRVFDTSDTTPANIWATIITQKSVNGYRQMLNAPPDSAKYYLLWTIRPAVVPPGPPTTATYLLSGPNNGKINQPASFMLQVPAGKSLPGGTCTVTPNDSGAGGTFTPASVVLTDTAPNVAFTYTPTAYGGKLISVTNSAGLTDPPPINFLCSADTYGLVGPSSGIAGVASDLFTVSLPQNSDVAGTVVVTPRSDSPADSLFVPFSPAQVKLAPTAPTATFSYQPGGSGARNVGATNNAGLTDPPPIAFTAKQVLAPDAVAGINRWWEGDQMAGWVDGQVSTGGAVPNKYSNNIGLYGTFKTNIVNGLPVARMFSASNGRFWENPLYASQPVTVLFVFAIRAAPAAGTYPFLWQTYGGQLIRVQSNNTLVATGNGGATYPISPANVLAAGFHIVAVRFDGVNSKMFLDGTEIGSGDLTGGAAPNDGSIGWYDAGGGASSLTSEALDADFAGWTVYAASVSDIDIDGLTLWWQQKYAL